MRHSSFHSSLPFPQAVELHPMTTTITGPQGHCQTTTDFCLRYKGSLVSSSQMLPGLEPTLYVCGLLSGPGQVQKCYSRVKAWNLGPQELTFTSLWPGCYIKYKTKPPLLFSLLFSSRRMCWVSFEARDISVSPKAHNILPGDCCLLFRGQEFFHQQSAPKTGNFIKKDVFSYLLLNHLGMKAGTFAKEKDPHWQLSTRQRNWAQ
ncbi:C-type lectin domain family 5 member A isoform X2 [Papio anubis]|uniref:C-type lectin domain family 5 member A isoform X2 n=1 Tax=Papio anubis TaxID=9555 RepID=UPI000B7B8E29|nr:C-type lectin domain family 5 member A isoform X2 [Papio anubis]